MNTVQQRNLESSILFIQQEHAATLKGLHEEIAKLQKRCSELTFQIASSEPEGSDDQTKKLQSLQEELQQNRESVVALQSSLREKDETLNHLQERFTSTEKMYQAKLTAKKETITTLSSQLDAQSAHVAYLVTELHKLKVLTLQSPFPPRPVTPPASSVKPAAPIHPLSSKVETPKSHRSSSPLTPTRPRSGSALSRFRSSRLVTAPMRETPPSTPRDQGGSPDEHFVKFKPTPPVLPPIVSGMEGSTEGRRVTRQQRVMRQNTIAIGSTASSEVPSLAVDQISPKRKSLLSESSRPADCN